MRSLVVMMLLGALGTPALAQQQHPCLHLKDVEKFQIVPGNGGILVTDVYHDQYLVILEKVCPNLNRNQGLNLRRTHSTGWACVAPGDVLLSYEQGSVSTYECAIREIVPFPPPAKPPGQPALTDGSKTGGTGP